MEIASTNETLRIATADVFAGWIEADTDRFVRWGFDAPTARRLLCRASRSTEPLEVAAATVAAAVRSEQRA